MKHIILMLVLLTSLLANITFQNDTQLNSFIEKIKKRDDTKELVKKMAKYINTKYTDYDTNIEAFDYAIDNIGKYHLSKLSPKIKFYLSGPKDLEIFTLIKLREQGLDNESIANILFSASGTYAPLGKKSKQILREKGFNNKVISIIDNYGFLSSGSKNLKIKDILVMANNGVDEKEISDLIISSKHTKTKYTKKSIKYLLSLGVNKHILMTLVYKKLLLSGPSDYKVYDIYTDLTKNKLSEDEIIKKIDATHWYYKDYSDKEKQILIKYGIPKKIVDHMTNVTDKFYSDMNNNTKKYIKEIEEKSSKQNNVHFMKMRTKLMNKARSNNAVLNGIKQAPLEKESIGKTIAKKVGNCAAQKLGFKACDKAPFPLNLGCKALVRNKFPCGI